MKRFLGLVIGLFSVIGFASSAEAINIDVAEVQAWDVQFNSGTADQNDKMSIPAYVIAVRGGS